MRSIGAAIVGDFAARNQSGYNPQTMPRPVVALLTDFGARDHYVGAVKGAVLAACREAMVVDITHEIPPHDVTQGAYVLAAAFSAFPAQTVFVAVVDPEVGTSRRGLALEAGGYLFVGPDNGIFTQVLALRPGATLHEITNAGLFRREVSPTFHARDVFAPVAGLLAQGTPLAHVGAQIQDPVLLEVPQVRTRGAGEWEGAVVHVDHFGNLITNVGAVDLAGMVAGLPADPTEMIVVVEGMVLPIVHTYADVQEGEACALVTSGRLEVGVNRGSAARLLGAGKGAPVRLRAVSANG